MTQSHDSRLILVEGLPGSGKTTLAGKLAADLRSQGKEVALYLEGDMHPCDLQWISRLTPGKYDAAVAQLRQHWQDSPKSEPWERIRTRLNDLSMVEEDHILTAYTKLDFADSELWNALDPFRDGEVHDHRVSTDDYLGIYTRRWQRFGERERESSTIFIFECAFLQSHITELLAFHDFTADSIIAFLAELLTPVRHLQPEIHYIRAENYPLRIREAAATRGDWLQNVVAYVASSPYGKARRLEGFDGAMTFFNERSRIERMAMDQLGLPTRTIQR